MERSHKIDIGIALLVAGGLAGVIRSVQWLRNQRSSNEPAEEVAARVGQLLGVPNGAQETAELRFYSHITPFAEELGAL
jgi:hypothetical protein